MRVITAVEKADLHLYDVECFLAGGICKCPEWQKVVIDELQKYQLDDHLIVFNPSPIGDPNASYEQIEWEFNQLERADIFSMYFSAGESDQPICMYELGRNIVRMQEKFHKSWGERIVISVEDGYRRKQDVIIQAKLAGIDVPTEASYEMHAKRIAEAYERIIRLENVQPISIGTTCYSLDAAGYGTLTSIDNIGNSLYHINIDGFDFCEHRDGIIPMDDSVNKTDPRYLSNRFATILFKINDLIISMQMISKTKPHFYVFRSGEDFNCWKNGACLSLEDAKYFDAGSRNREHLTYDELLSIDRLFQYDRNLEDSDSLIYNDAFDDDDAWNTMIDTWNDSSSSDNYLLEYNEAPKYSEVNIDYDGSELKMIERDQII